MANAVAAKTVVVADAAAHIRDRFRAAIEAAGHRAVGVRSAAELLARVRADLPRIDLIVLDLRLPPADGVDLVRRVRRLEGGRLPILVFSGTIVSADQVRELASLGVTGYVNGHSDSAHIRPALAPHLFPDNFNRRHSPRVVVAIPVAYRTGETIAAATMLNLGKGGVAIGTMSPLASSARARIRFLLQGTGREVEADARVVWSDGHAGMGLQFERVDPADQAAIDRYVDSHFFDGSPAGAPY
ncbi:MAG: response regulator [Acidobacteria bacterium]|nr:MAG: response regulator [Acidobacteriota bacterium]RPJ84831.1 MAG: response regulator [Acidobacteriota bacterium]